MKSFLSLAVLLGLVSLASLQAQASETITVPRWQPNDFNLLNTYAHDTAWRKGKTEYWS